MVSCWAGDLDDDFVDEAHLSCSPLLRAQPSSPSTEIHRQLLLVTDSQTEMNVHSDVVCVLESNFNFQETDPK